MTNERMRFYAAGPGQPMIAVCTPYDKSRRRWGTA